MADPITITNAGHNFFRAALSGTVSGQITYVALGTSNATPTTADTQLGTEVFRKPVTSYVNGANIGEILINLYLAPSDSLSTNIQEVGFFAGAATAAANTGTLLAHGLYSHTRPSTAIESIQFILDLTV